MIEPEYFQKEIILKKRDELEIADPGLFEKAIHAFSLLGHLADSGIEFVFKGGTSLLLHLPVPQRLSIDIDILCSEKSEKLISVLNNIGKMTPLLEFSEDEREHKGLPKRRHFKFKYNSIISRRKDYVLLDVVEEPISHSLTEEKLIRTIFFETRRDVIVQIPTIEALLGDKLTAFAPKTVGVPFVTKKGHDHSLQVVKQLFDVGQLFNAVNNFKTISNSYLASFELENSYRVVKCTREEALDDTAETALELCRFGLRRHSPSNTSRSLLNGISKIQNHLIRNQFRPDLEAKVAASKAYMLSRMIRANSFDVLIEHGKFIQSDKQIEQIRKISIDPQLDKLKMTNPEAFYYLALCSLI